MYKLSRHWNRVVYFFINLLVMLLWDYTKKNINTQEYQSGYDPIDETLEEILTGR